MANYEFVGPVIVQAPTVDGNPATKLYVDDQIDLALEAVGPAEHTHDAADIITGTLDIGRIPTGTTHDQVSYGDHEHSGYAASLHATTHATGGTDPLTPAAIGAATSGHTHAPTAHVHDGADITTGTIATARLSVGTTAGTVAAGNDTRFSIKPFPPVALTDGSSIVINASLSNHFRVSLLGTPRAFATPTNPTDGQIILLEITNSTASSLSPSFNSAWASGSDFSLTTIVAGKTDLTQWEYRADRSKWWLIGYSKGYG